MSDLLVSYIRTYVPLLVGFALTWLGQKLGIILDENTSAAVAAGAVAIVTAVYYFVVRLFEQKWPVVGKLLGHSTTPAYEGTS